MSDVQDQELFDAAFADVVPEAVEEKPQDQSKEEQQAKEEHPAEAVANPEASEPANDTRQEQQPQREPANVPSWRLAEEAQARRDAEQRLQEATRMAEEANRRAAEYENYLRQQREQQQRQQQPVPDFLEDPDKFVAHGVKEAIDPLHNSVQQVREYYSQQLAVQRFGEETVNSAYKALDDALKHRDPEASNLFARMQNAIDPFSLMVNWHKRNTVVSQIGDDPQAWFEKQLEERLKDPQTQAALLEKIRGQAQQNGSAPVTKLPPSINKMPAARETQNADDADMSDAGLLDMALRR